MDIKKKALIVDDEIGILRVVSIGLSIAGYDVITTSSGEESLKLVVSAMPDIMVLDLLMEPLTGFEILERLRAFSQLPVIVFTARNDMAALALKAGANGFIAKPFKPELLVQKIKDVLDSPNTAL